MNKIIKPISVSIDIMNSFYLFKMNVTFIILNIRRKIIRSNGENTVCLRSPSERLTAGRLGI